MQADVLLGGGKKFSNLSLRKPRAAVQRAELHASQTVFCLVQDEFAHTVAILRKASRFFMGLTGKNDRANVTLFAQEHSRASTGSHRTKSDCQFEI